MMRIEFIEYGNIIPDWTDTQIMCHSGVICFESFSDYVNYLGDKHA